MEKNNTFLYYDPNLVYPDYRDSFSPDLYYPEYPWKDCISLEKNPVYDAIRQMFIGMNFDKDHIGTSEWNPLGDYITPGDRVVIKPNWVMHFNEKDRSQKGLDCLVTHPSVLRPIIDYALIALKGEGTLVVGDAPMQGADLDELLAKPYYKSLLDFYKNNGIPVIFEDFRSVKTNSKGIGGVVETIQINPENQGIIVDLGEQSKHFGLNGNEKYKVSDYLASKTQDFHHDKTHEYVVNKSVLEADVIINVPKPKTHRLAGITAAQKNMVGVTFKKECLPHRKIGDTKKHKGDAYENPSVIKTITEVLDEKAIISQLCQKKTKAFLFNSFSKALFVMAKPFYKDEFRIGSWYGNDTIWRTILDLNRIIIFADKNGEIKDKPQRIMLNIGDMVVSGEKNGPVSPEYKECHMILWSTMAANFDLCVCNIMGFDYKKIPSVYNADIEFSDIIFSNKKDWDNLTLAAFQTKSVLNFLPHDQWKGKIEKQYR